MEPLPFICGGSAYDPDQGRNKPCPLRTTCRWVVAKAVLENTTGPYDFDDEECEQYKENDNG